MSFVFLSLRHVCQLSPKIGSKKQLEFRHSYFIVQEALSAAVAFVFEFTFPGIVYNYGRQI